MQRRGLLKRCLQLRIPNSGNYAVHSVASPLEHGIAVLVNATYMTRRRHVGKQTHGRLNGGADVCRGRPAECCTQVLRVTNASANVLVMCLVDAMLRAIPLVPPALNPIPSSHSSSSAHA